jgi:RNA polymerase sigma factor (sigma-70 family)
MMTHYADLLRYARKHHVRDAEDAEDVVQTVYLHVLERRQEPTRAYMFRALKNELLNRKRDKRRTEMLREDFVEPEPSPCAEHQVQTLTASLNPSDRDFIMAAFRLGYERAAVEYGSTYAAVRKRGSRIVQHLKTFVKNLVLLV